MQEKKEAVLRVEDPDPSHVGRNIVTLDRRTKELLEITSGDIVELEGTKRTAAVVWPARAEDEGKGTIRMDHLIRKNCGSGLGDKVTVRKSIYSEAKKVVIAPTQQVRIIARGYERILKRNFIGRPVNKGDNIWVSVFGSGFIYQVIETLPKGTVKVTDFTQFMINEEPIKGAVEGAAPKVSYEDIGGLEEQVMKVREMIELPMKHPELFRKLGIQPPKGVLLHGPPGTGKTMLAKAVASETEAHFIAVNSPSVMSKFVGEAEERIRQVFKEAEKNAPSIIFFDEIDAIAPKRDEVVGEVERRVVAQILAAMDGMEARGNVIVIAATNRVNSIDEALRRPGRFDREIEFPVPDKKGRYEVLQVHTRGMPISPPIDKEAIDKALKIVLNREAFLKMTKTHTDKLKGVKNLEEMRKSLVFGNGENEDGLATATANELSDKLKLCKDTEELKKFLSSLEEQIKDELSSTAGRKQILSKLKEFDKTGDRKKYLAQISGREKDSIVNMLVSVFLDDLAIKLHGFVGADLEALAKESAMKALRRYLPKINLKEETIPEEVLESLEVNKDDFETALKDIQPSALREITIEIPNIRWSDIGGLEEVKDELKQAIEWPMKNPKIFKEMGIKPPKGILLYGPPGTGKTMLAKAVATEAESNFISIKGPELMSKWVGDTEKGIRSVFKKARQVSPVIVFFDEIDAMAMRRGGDNGSHVYDSAVNQILTEIDGVELLKDVVVVAATNRPDLVDPGLLRPGRFDKLIYVPSPDEKARLAILKVHTKEMPLDPEVNIKELAKKMEFYTGAEIEGVAREAALICIKENKMKAAKIKNSHFEAAMKKVAPAVSKDMSDAYEGFSKQYASFKPSYVR